MAETGQDWEDLLVSIREKYCTPIIGAGAAAPWIPSGSDIAYDLAREFNYPDKLEGSSILSRVAQFVAISCSYELAPKEILRHKFEKISVPDFSLEENRNTTYAVLADLNLPVYITTNYDHFLEEALRSKGRNPVSQFCAWSENLRRYLEFSATPTYNEKYVVPDESNDKRYVPDESNPLVYHLHGDLNTPVSMVLTENDYMDFLITAAREERMLPIPILRALARSSLLFIGYSLEDINFRAILKIITPMPGVKSTNIAVLRPPPQNVLTDHYQSISMNILDICSKYMSIGGMHPIS